MGDEFTIPLVMESITSPCTAPKAVIPVYQARSCDEFRSPDLNFTRLRRDPAMTIVNCLADGRLRLAGVWRGSGDAPIFFVPAIVIRLARLGQKLEAIRGSWSGGSADGRVQSSVSLSELLHVAGCSLQRGARNPKSSRVSKIFLSVKVIPYTQASGGPRKPLGDT